MQQTVEWSTRPVSLAEQKEIFGFTSPNTFKAHEKNELIPPEFPVGPNRKARHGADLKEVVDARAAGATDEQVRTIVRRQKTDRAKWLEELMGGAA
ncbi:MAG: hypothetical protein HOE61_02220 [Candidatus Marinimicrobia bacterium]|jgi:hypothetical protein|nr:hypothetical protein [Candidatus Neomarinimicrobiota bacterium]